MVAVVVGSHLLVITGLEIRVVALELEAQIWNSFVTREAATTTPLVVIVVVVAELIFMAAV